MYSYMHAPNRRDIRLAFDLGCLESELLEFLLSHHTTVCDKVNIREGDDSVGRSVDALHNPDIPKSEKDKFIATLKVQLGALQDLKRGKPSEEEMSKVISSIKEFVMRSQPRFAMIFFGLYDFDAAQFL